mmetsp:Transcript_10489/g.24298  ORF Transcript_10489/g.24298 Transcript_10489/m.24298 type:complete len:268 (-) Transcript_10489:4893-5696(-)
MVQASDVGTTAPAAMIVAHDMHAVHKTITQKITNRIGALVAFDVDMTLTVPQHPACYYPNMEKYKLVLKRFFEPLNDLEEDKVLTLAAQMPGQQLAEKDTLVVIKALQQQDIKTIALTASLSGWLEGLGNLQVRRFQDLKALGIDFQEAFPQQEILLTTFPPHNDNHPMYHQGVLYANGGRGASNKGAVLVAFLRSVQCQPQQIIMVDDRMHNLTDIKQALIAFDPTIQFTGIIYHGAETYAPENITQQAMIAYWGSIVDRVTNSRA